MYTSDDSDWKKTLQNAHFVTFQFHLFYTISFFKTKHVKSQKTGVFTRHAIILQIFSVWVVVFFAEMLFGSPVHIWTYNNVCQKNWMLWFYFQGCWIASLRIRFGRPGPKTHIFSAVVKAIIWRENSIDSQLGGHSTSCQEEKQGYRQGKFQSALKTVICEKRR